MSWWQAMLTILLGNLIVLVPMVLIAHPGTRYGIPFPVLARASFGTRGANVPAILRGLVACGWFGIQTWIGGQAIHTMLRDRVPRLGAGAGRGAWIAFFAFWLMNMYIVVRGSNAIKRLEAWAAPFLIVAGLALLAWAALRAGGLGPILAQPSKFRTAGEFLAFFVPSLTAMVGFWATLALNIPDLSRYARDQKAQIRGSSIGLPTTMTLFSFIGVAVTSASVLIFGEAIWDPVVLLSRLGNPLVHPDLAVRAADRDAHHQRRRQRGGAGQRLRQPLAVADQLRHRRRAHGHPGDRDHALAAALRLRHLHLRLAGRLLELPGADRRDLHRRLLADPQGAALAARSLRVGRHLWALELEGDRLADRRRRPRP